MYWVLRVNRSTYQKYTHMGCCHISQSLTSSLSFFFLFLFSIFLLLFFRCHKSYHWVLPMVFSPYISSFFIFLFPISRVFPKHFTSSACQITGPVWGWFWKFWYTSHSINSKPTISLGKTKRRSSFVSFAFPSFDAKTLH